MTINDTWNPPSRHPDRCWVAGEYLDHDSGDVRVTAFYCGARLQWFRGSADIKGEPILLADKPIRWRFLSETT